MSDIKNFEEMQKAFLEMQKALEKVAMSSQKINKTNFILSGLLFCALGVLAFACYKAYEYKKKLGDLQEKVEYLDAKFVTLDKRFDLATSYR